MSLVDQLDAKLFARRDKQFDQNLQMENLKLKTTIASNDAQFKQGNLNLQNQQLINTQQRNNALTQIGMANLALNKRKLDDDKAYKDKMLDINVSQFGVTSGQTDRKLDQSGKMVDANIDQGDRGLKLKAKQIDDNIKTSTSTRNRYNQITPYAVASAKTASEAGDFNLATQRRNQPFQDNMLRNQSGLSDLNYDFTYQTNPARIAAQLSNYSSGAMMNDQNLIKARYGNEILKTQRDNAEPLIQAQIADLNRRIQETPTLTGTMAATSEAMAPVQNLISSKGPKGARLQSLFGMITGNEGLRISGDARRQVGKAVKDIGYKDLKAQLVEARNALSDPNITRDQLNAYSTLFNSVTNNIDAFGVPRKQRKDLLRISQGGGNIVNTAFKNSAMMNSK